MTVVGDLAQTGTSAGATDWAEVLTPHVGTSWRVEELTVNYRTPAEVMAVATDVLALAAPGATPSRSVREVGEEPWAVQVPTGELAERVAAAAAELAAHEGTLTVVAPRSRVEEVAAAVAARVPGTSWGPDADSARGPVVLTPTQTKGLEFDSVLLADPAGVLAEGARGASDLYVALTRTTRRLGVVSPGPLPAVLAALPVRTQQPA
jgi:DNA helicase IV